MFLLVSVLTTVINSLQCAKSPGRKYILPSTYFINMIKTMLQMTVYSIGE